MEESYKCKFCFKSFINGRALGGHMRSHTHTHMPSLVHKFGVFEDEEDEDERPSQLSYETESDVSSEEDDPKFGLTGSVLEEEDGESETNVVVSNLTRKRSKRTRKLESFGDSKKTKPSQLGYNNNPDSWNESEPVHSSEAASDTTTEEDLAFCLMMLSRDKWKKNKKNELREEIETEEEKDYDKSKICNRIKGKYKCETCGKVFKSYQALGGHRASHKKNRVCNNNNKTEQRSEKTEHDDHNVVAEKRIHQCPICLRVFASGQALGGHKRSHGIGNLSVNRVNRIESVMMKQRMIDLNLPAPNEEDEVVSSSMVLFQ